jgi:hypothetical protein
VVRHLPEVKPKIPLFGVSLTDIPLQGASKRTVGDGQGHLVSQEGEPCLAQKALSGCARQKLKKARARASKAGSGGIQQPGNASVPKQGETSNRPRSEGSTPQKWPELQKGPGSLVNQGLIRSL